MHECCHQEKVIVLWRCGYSLEEIQQRLREEEIEVTLRSLQRLHDKFQSFHTVHDLAKTRRSRLLRLLMKEMMNATDQSLENDDELTARKLRTKLAGEFPNLLSV